MSGHLGQIPITQNTQSLLLINDLSGNETKESSKARRRQRKCSVLSSGREIPGFKVGTKKSIPHERDSGLRRDSNQGPMRCEVRPDRTRKDKKVRAKEKRAVRTSILSYLTFTFNAELSLNYLAHQ